jgi:hypothetical protein
MKIEIKFHEHPTIEVVINDTETGRAYFEISKKQHQLQAPFFRDTRDYTADYMIQLAHEAKKVFGWNWLSDRYDTSITARLHKDLENSIGKLGFAKIPAEYDNLLYDLHHCLHAIQFGKTQSGREDNLQIEWLTDNSVPLPASFSFQESSKFGDLILINPYVGHNPLQIYRENDFDFLSTTCKFHDIIKPGIVLLSQDTKCDKDAIVEKFKENDQAFVNLHGADKIRYYSGEAVIGRTLNVDVLKQIKRSPSLLILDKVEFSD